MIVLFETPAGYSLFKVREINASDGSRFSRFSDVSNKFILYCSFTSCIFLSQVANEKKLSKTDPDDMYKKFFSSAEDATSSVNLLSFQPFMDTADAVSAATACIEGKMTKSLKKFLKKELKSKELKGESLAVADKALAVNIKDGISSLNVVNDSKTNELFRGIRCYLDELLEDTKETAASGSDIRAMQLGLSHSLSRYKLKFSADKVDTMVIQAVGLLDELDKEINTYAMRVKEWYGWHFPGT